MIINIAKTIFTWSFVISLFLSIFIDLNKKDRSSLQHSKEDETSKIESVITTIIVLITIATIIGVFLLIIFKYEKLRWITALAGIPLYLSYVVGTYSSVGIIRNLVQIESKDRLSARENWAIQTISYVLFFIDVYKLPTKLMDFLKNIENNMIYDLLYITSYIGTLFLYTFLICALLSRPMILLSKLLIKLNGFLRSKTKIFKIGDFFVKEIDKNNLKRPILLKLVGVMKMRCKVLYVLVWVLSPILIIIDVCLFVLQILHSFLFECIGYLLLLLRMIKRTLGKLMLRINNLLDRKLVATSFRVALIVTLTLTVIVNRYTPLLKEYDASTGVLEFVSSAILIPVIFQWIVATNTKECT